MHYSPLGHKESDTTEWLNWTALNDDLLKPHNTANSQEGLGSVFHGHICSPYTISYTSYSWRKTVGSTVMQTAVSYVSPHSPFGFPLVLFHGWVQTQRAQLGQPPPGLARGLHFRLRLYKPYFSLTSYWLVSLGTDRLTLGCTLFNFKMKNIIACTS